MKIDDTLVVYSVGETVLLTGNAIRYMIEALVPGEATDRAFETTRFTIDVRMKQSLDHSSVTIYKGHGTQIVDELIWEGTFSQAISCECQRQIGDILCAHNVPGDSIAEALNFKTLMYRCIC